MLIWIIALIVAVILFGASLVYLTNRIYNIPFVDSICNSIHSRKLILSIAVILVMIGIIIIAMNMTNAVVIFVHLTIFWIIMDIIARIIYAFNGHVKVSGNIIALAVLLITVSYFAWGWYQLHHVTQTNYSLSTEKELGELHILQISDSHVGTSFHGDEMSRFVDEMNKNDIDIAVITGDFVDDDTSKKDMIKACEAIGKIDARYGIYFVFGNHDRGYYNNRGYSGEDLINELSKNGITSLQDESVLIDDRFYLIGRRDASETVEKSATRQSMDELTKNLDTGKYMVVLDHQPVDYEAQQKSGVDLVLSGHTHGGQMYPLTYLMNYIGENDSIYGLKHRGNTDFIVNSGISDWSVKFKTGCRSEYVFITIKSQSGIDEK